MSSKTSSSTAGLASTTRAVSKPASQTGGTSECCWVAHVIFLIKEASRLRLTSVHRPRLPQVLHLTDVGHSRDPVPDGGAYVCHIPDPRDGFSYYHSPDHFPDRRQLSGGVGQRPGTFRRSGGLLPQNPPGQRRRRAAAPQAEVYLSQQARCAGLGLAYSDDDLDLHEHGNVLHGADDLVIVQARPRIVSLPVEPQARRMPRSGEE